jgi:hypothetical protein
MGDYNELMRNLNADEIREFENGDPNSTFVQNTDTPTNNARFQPFDRSFEISPENLFVGAYKKNFHHSSIQNYVCFCCLSTIINSE